MDTAPDIDIQHHTHYDYSLLDDIVTIILLWPL